MSGCVLGVFFGGEGADCVVFGGSDIEMRRKNRKMRAQERKFTSLKSGVVFAVKLVLKRLLS